MREQISGAIAEALLASKPAPSNEQETCFRIIDPLIRAMDYGYQDIKVQDRDKAREKPDYTILPDAPDQTWFLEAKAWSVTLADEHAIQAVNYANTQGKRWVVLSNGREWRLYDNHILGTVDAKLACVSKLGDEGFSGFLESLSKSSIQQQKLEDFVRNERLYTCLSNQIARPDSEVIKAIVKALKTLPGLSNVSATDVVGFWRDHGSAAVDGAMTAEDSPAMFSGEEAEAPLRDRPSNAQSISSTYPLGTRASTDITGTKIRSLTRPDGRLVPVVRWNQLIVQVALVVIEQDRMPPLPFFRSSKSKSPLVAKVGSAESERMREPMNLPPPYSEVLVEGHFSAADIQGSCVLLLRAAGLDPTSFQIAAQRD